MHLQCDLKWKLRASVGRQRARQFESESRRQIEIDRSQPQLIVTQRGAGYRLDTDVQTLR